MPAGPDSSLGFHNLISRLFDDLRKECFRPMYNRGEPAGNVCTAFTLLKVLRMVAIGYQVCRIIETDDLVCRAR